MRKIKLELSEGEYFKCLEQFLWYETVWSVAVDIQVMAKPCAFSPCSQKKAWDQESWGLLLGSAVLFW